MESSLRTSATAVVLRTALRLITFHLPKVFAWISNLMVLRHGPCLIYSYHWTCPSLQRQNTSDHLQLEIYNPNLQHAICRNCKQYVDLQDTLVDMAKPKFDALEAAPAA